MRRNRSPVPDTGIITTAEQLGCHERTRRIMHRDELQPLRQRLQSTEHGFGPGRPAGNHPQSQPRQMPFHLTLKLFQKIRMNGKHEVLGITIKPEAVDPDDIEMLEDLVAAAVNATVKQVDETAEAEMGKLTGGLNIPGL